MPRTVNDRGLEEAIIEAKGYLVAAFFQAGSDPSRRYEPEFAGLAELLGGRAEFVRIEVAENPTVAEDLGVDAAPSTLVFKDGEEVARYEGPYSKESLKGRIEDLMAARRPPRAA